MSKSVPRTQLSASRKLPAARPAPQHSSDGQQNAAHTPAVTGPGPLRRRLIKVARRNLRQESEWSLRSAAEWWLTLTTMTISSDSRSSKKVLLN